MRLLLFINVIIYWCILLLLPSWSQWDMHISFYMNYMPKNAEKSCEIIIMQFYIYKHCTIILKTSDNTTTPNTRTYLTTTALTYTNTIRNVIWTYMCSIRRVTNCFFVHWKQSRCTKNDVIIYEWKLALVLVITNWSSLIVCLDTATGWYEFNNFIDHGSVSLTSRDRPDSLDAWCEHI